MKKVLAALLVVVMMIPVVSSMAFAAETNLNLAGWDTALTAAPASPGAVTPANTVYIIPADTAAPVGSTDNVGLVAADLADKDLYKFAYDKENDANKIISSIKLVEKVHSVWGRIPMVEVKFKEDMTTTEYKVTLELAFTKKGVGDKYIETVTFWVQNAAVPGSDRTAVAGTKGTTHKPVVNEENVVEWFGVDGDTIAELEYEAASDTTAYYPKLSTKWDNAVYAAMFADQDAYIYSFVGNPTISATARPVLTLYNPYVEDDELTVPLEDIIVYQVIDDEFVDVTANFDIGENDNGDQVLVTKTRTLGTYVIAEYPLEADVVEEPVTEGGKEVPNTGR